MLLVFSTSVEGQNSDHLVWDSDKLVLGYIHEVKPHPDADRLVLAMVDHGTGEIEQIVTGAPNLFPYKGKGELDPPLPAPAISAFLLAHLQNSGEDHDGSQ